MWLKNIMVINTVFAIIESSRGTKQHNTNKEKENNMENAILRAIESGIKERAYETVRQLSELVVNNYQFTDEAKDFADMVLSELEEN